jgi:hypothetical protein
MVKGGENVNVNHPATVPVVVTVDCAIKFSAAS